MKAPDRAPWRLLALTVMVVLTAADGRAASQLRLGAVLGGEDAAGFARAQEPREFRFPEDHGAHPRYRSEWWYLTANLESAAGEAFGVQFTLFRQALRAQPVIGGPWDASQLYLGHLAVTDVAARRHVEAERLSRGHPRLAGVSVAPFKAHVDGWSLEAAGPGLNDLTLRAATGEFAVRLSLDAVKPIVLQGNSGLSAKGPGQASYYYSLPRLAAAGEISIGGRTVAVTGAAWLDREWSTSVLADSQTGWDWFALQLEGGRELMVFQLRNRSGLRDPYDQGVWVDADGQAHQLRNQDFTLEALEHWEDELGVRWPVVWRLSVLTPEGPRQWTVRAAVDDQRMDTLLTYWEGLVGVYDDTGARSGTGYMELTGYE